MLSSLNALLPGKIDVANGGYYNPYRNKIINGDFNIAQRTASALSGAASTYVPDRWRVTTGLTSGSLTFNQPAHANGQTDVPGNPQFYLHITGASAVMAANSSNYIQQRIESVTTCNGKLITVTFYARSSVARNVGVLFAQIFGTGGSPSTTAQTPATTISLTTTFQRFDVTFNIPSISGKTLGTNNDNSLSLVFVLSSNGTATTGWGLGADISDIGSATIDFSRVSVVEGDATNENDPFSPRHIQQELALCQRYYQSYSSLIISGYNVSSGVLYNDYTFSYMRAIPTATPSAVSNLNAVTLTTNSVTQNHYQARAVITTTGSGYVLFNLALDAEL
jgi:hypothetical protein